MKGRGVLVGGASVLAAGAAVLVGVTMSSADEPLVAPVCEDHANSGTPAEQAAWDELEALAELGLPVCDLQWKFVDDIEGSDALGRTDYGNDGVLLVADLEEYGSPELAELELRSVVRHELGHYLVRWHGISSRESDLREIFTDPVIEDDLERPGSEVAAEAVGAVLSDLRGEEFWPYYVEEVSPESMAAAEVIVGAFTE